MNTGWPTVQDAASDEQFAASTRLSHREFVRRLCSTSWRIESPRRDHADRRILLLPSADELELISAVARRRRSPSRMRAPTSAWRRGSGPCNYSRFRQSMSSNQCSRTRSFKLGGPIDITVLFADIRVSRDFPSMRHRKNRRPSQQILLRDD